MARDPLAGLRDIHLPPPPDFTFLLLAALIPLLLLLLWGVIRQRRRRRPQRRALRQLAALAERHGRDGDADHFVAGLANVLRRYAAQRYPGVPVAGLTGEAWLAFLDSHGGGGAFRSGAGAILAWRPYRAGGGVDAAGLCKLAADWICRNPP